MKDFLLSFTVNAPIEKIYEVLTTQKGLQGWWTEDCDVDTKVGGRVALRFGTTNASMRVEKLTPHTEVVWHCVSQHHEAPALKKTDEWAGTNIYFRLRALSDKQTQVDFLHKGLTPSMECYMISEKGWVFYLKTSLKEYAETGLGKNFQSKAIEKVHSYALH